MTYKVLHSPRSWLRVSGPDALRFLNGMWTADLKLATRDAAALPTGGAAFFLDLKGKPVSPAVFVALAADDFVFSVPAADVQALHEALDRYLVADEVQMKIEADWAQAYVLPEGWDGADAPSRRLAPLVPADESRIYRVEDLGWGYRVPRGILGAKHEEIWIKPEQKFPMSHEPVELASYAERRVESGVPEWGRDYGRDSLILEFPHLDVISFHKGCYIGQEVVARATYRGRMVKGFARFTAQAPLEEGFVYARSEPDKPVGKLTTVAGPRGLGVLRLRALEEGALFQKTAAGEVAIEKVELLIPSEAT
jgi:folate-binding protein YgfZ